MKKIFVIHGAQFSTLEGFYEHFGRVVLNGARWGQNLDALNDALRGGFGTPDEGFIIHWKDHALSKQRLGAEETTRQLHIRMTRCHPDNIPSIQAKLDRLSRGQGSTAFDWIHKAIVRHCPGGDEANDGVELVLL
jgi:RNAse (barnase) inhibitor barstar